MSAGKLASQAGHAFLGAFLRCGDPELLSKYHKDFPESPGTKVCLKARSLSQLLYAEQAATSSGVPVFRVVDSGCKNFFDGRPIITALGIGPATRKQVEHITRKFQLL
jgi:peptidyl-tRNA hydrolase, PTH2 family